MTKNGPKKNTKKVRDELGPSDEDEMDFDDMHDISSLPTFKKKKYGVANY